MDTAPDPNPAKRNLTDGYLIAVALNCVAVLIMLAAITFLTLQAQSSRSELKSQNEAHQSQFE